MQTGTVKWFNAQKGFGFIQPESGGKDVFVHISAVERAGLGTLAEGQKVTYEVMNERGKEAAGNLKPPRPLTRLLVRTEKLWAPLALLLAVALFYKNAREARLMPETFGPPTVVWTMRRRVWLSKVSRRPGMKAWGAVAHVPIHGSALGLSLIHI